MGRSIEAMIVATADQIARRVGSSTNLRKARMPRKAKSRTAVEVRRGSQSHHTPQVGLAQIAPWQHSRNASRLPISRPASIRVSHFRSFMKRNAIAEPREKRTTSIHVHAVGTWTYMIRCTSPMYRSAGTTKRPMNDPASRRITPATSSKYGNRLVETEGASMNAPAFCINDSVVDDAAVEQAAE